MDTRSALRGREDAPRFGSSFRSSRPPRRGKTRVEHQSPDSRTRPAPVAIPVPGEDTVRIIPLSGVEEVGRNMTAIEFGGDIFIVDCGFSFSEVDTPGIDYILPNTGYLEERRDKIRGLLITHGHLDHIGGIPYIIDRIGNPIIYTRKLTGMMIKKRQEEFAQTAPVQIREVEKDEVIKLGRATIRFFGVTHTVPDSMGIIIETPWGTRYSPAISSSITWMANRRMKKKRIRDFQESKSSRASDGQHKCLATRLLYSRINRLQDARRHHQKRKGPTHHCNVRIAP